MQIARFNLPKCHGGGGPDDGACLLIDGLGVHGLPELRYRG